MKVSDCCGASPKAYPGPHGTADSDSMDYGICPDCGDHCEYVEEQFDCPKEIEDLTRQISALHETMKKCEHRWGTVKYDPQRTREWVFDRYESHGSDPEPIGHYVDGKNIPRWSRKCQKCGKVEYTSKVEVTKTEPVF